MTSSMWNGEPHCGLPSFAARQSAASARRRQSCAPKNLHAERRVGTLMSAAWAVLLGVFLYLIGTTVDVRAEAPSVEALFPAGGKQGSALHVTVTGKLNSTNIN